MDSLPIINKTYEVYKSIINLNKKMEKRWRYSLGLNIETSILDCMEILIIAKNAPKPLKGGYLLKALGKFEATILKLRLILELNLANETKVFQLQSDIAEICRMAGGWLKSLQNT